VRDIKEKLTYVVNNFEEAVKESEESHACEKSYELPDGRKIVIGSERFRASEIYF
jgi:actin beta/gamma 1